MFAYMRFHRKFRMSNSKEKQLKLKGIRLKRDSEDMKNLASTMPLTFENIEILEFYTYSLNIYIYLYIISL